MHHPDPTRDHIDQQLVSGDSRIVELIESEALSLISDTGRGPWLAADLRSILSHLRATNNTPTIRAMFRYLREGSAHSYQEDPHIFRWLHSSGHLDSLDSILDLGAGPGGLVSQARRHGHDAYGVDVSPSFVQKDTHLTLGLIDSTPAMLHLERFPRQNFDLVLSSLTLDRVADPAQLIANMACIPGRKKGILITLLPIQPEDDEEVGWKITYTLAGRRLANTGTVDGDQAIIHDAMAAAFGSPIIVERLSYTVHTSTGIQEYRNVYAFIAKAT